MIDKQEAAIFKSKQDFNRNKEKISEYIKYAENWQVISVICSYIPMACDVLLIVTMIAFFLKYSKTMQAMPELFYRQTPKILVYSQFKQIRFHNGICCTGYYDYCMYSSYNYYHVFLLHEMQTHSHYIQNCFPFLPISHIVCTSHHTNLFVKVTNITKGNSI